MYLDERRKKMSIGKYIPNALSLLRGAVIAPLVLYEAIWKQSWSAALVVLIIGNLTDAFDGYLAMRLNARSKIGQNLLDPLADGALIVAALLGLISAEEIRWTTVIVVAAVSAVIWTMHILARLNCRIRPSRFSAGLLVVYGVGVYLWLDVRYIILSNALWLIIPALVLGAFLIKIKRTRVNAAIKDLRAGWISQ